MEISCPSCGTASYLEDATRDAGAFCRQCDFPLFWARTDALVAGVGAVGTDGGLRRLPGTAGRRSIDLIDCPACEEHNGVQRKICIRCGSLLRPAPVVFVPPPPPVVEAPPVVEPPPPVHRFVWWPWVLLAVAAAALTILIYLLV